MSAACGPKLVENAVTGRRFAMKGMSAFWATLMSFRLVRVLGMAFYQAWCWRMRAC